MTIVVESPFADARPEPAVYVSLEVAAAYDPPVEAMERRGDIVRCIVREQMLISTHTRSVGHWARLAKGVSAAQEGRFTDLTGLSDEELIASLCS